VQPLRCDRCDLVLFPGDERFIVSIQVSRDRDETDDMLFSDSKLARLLEALEQEDDLPLSEDGNMVFTLCPRCRRVFLENPLNVQLPKGVAAARMH